MPPGLAATGRESGSKGVTDAAEALDAGSMPQDVKLAPDGSVFR
jgi:hypothetical protein